MKHKRVFFTFIYFAFSLIASTANSQSYQDIEKLPFSEIAKYADYDKTPNILNSVEIVSRLRSLLEDDYQDFAANFKDWSIPVVLGSRGVFFDGWASNDFENPRASAFLIYPDGQLYAAYTQKNSNIIKYYTNENKGYIERIHPAFKAWQLRFEGQFLFFDRDEQELSWTDRYSLDGSQQSMLTAALTSEQQAQLRKVAESLWGLVTTANWEMDERLGRVISEATDEILKCSTAYSLVPKPAGFAPGVYYIVSNAEPIASYFLGLKSAPQPQYRFCINATALKHRSAATMAGLVI